MQSVARCQAIAILLIFLALQLLLLCGFGDFTGDIITATVSPPSPPGVLPTGIEVEGRVVLDPKQIINLVNISSRLESSRFVVFTMLSMQKPYVSRKALRMVASLRATGSAALVVIFSRVATVRAVEAEFERFGNVVVVGFPDDKSHTRSLWWPSSFRYTLAKLFLDYHFHHFDAVMTSDMTDVIFQEDPFVWAMSEFNRTGKELIVAEEEAVLGGGANPSDTIDGGINLNWIKECRADASRVLKKHVLCSGTTIGTARMMQHYLTQMDGMTRNGYCGAIGQDQGAHNYLVYTKPTLASNMLPQNFRTGRIITMHGVPIIRFDSSSGRLVNAEGRPYVVTHQINRCGWAKEFVNTTGKLLHDGSLETVPSELRCPSVEWPPYFSVPSPLRTSAGKEDGDRSWWSKLLAWIGL